MPLSEVFGGVFTDLFFFSILGADFLCISRSHTPQVPPLLQCAHLLQLRQAVQLADPVQRPTSCSAKASVLFVVCADAKCEVNVAVNINVIAFIIIISGVSKVPVGDFAHIFEPLPDVVHI